MRKIVFILLFCLIATTVAWYIFYIFFPDHALGVDESTIIFFVVFIFSIISLKVRTTALWISTRILKGGRK